jgi:hypothetical protein
LFKKKPIYYKITGNILSVWKIIYDEMMRVRPLSPYAKEFIPEIVELSLPCQKKSVTLPIEKTSLQIPIPIKKESIPLPMPIPIPIKKDGDNLSEDFKDILELCVPR